MMLEIARHDDKPHTISYRRDNGTCTWMPADDFFVRHDLSHYAVEKKLGYTKAFMGMVNNGMEIKDFEDREKRNKMIISKDAMYAEHMANLFLMEIAQGEFDNFNQVVAETFKSVNPELAPPVLSNGELTVIRKFLQELYKTWNELPVDKTMSLPISL